MLAAQIFMHYKMCLIVRDISNQYKYIRIRNNVVTQGMTKNHEHLETEQLFLTLSNYKLMNNSNLSSGVQRPLL